MKFVYMCVPFLILKCNRFSQNMEFQATPTLYILTLYYPSNSKADARSCEVEATQRCLMYVPELISKSSEVLWNTREQHGNSAKVLFSVYTYTHTYRVIEKDGRDLKPL